MSIYLKPRAYTPSHLDFLICRSQYRQSHPSPTSAISLPLPVGSTAQGTYGLSLQFVSVSVASFLLVRSITTAMTQLRFKIELMLEDKNDVTTAIYTWEKLQK